MFAGLFHAALSLAVMLYEGQRLSQALQRSVTTMVTSCVQKQLQDSVSVRANLPAAGVIFGQQLAANGKLFVVSCGMCLEGIHAAFEWGSILRDKLQSELSCKPHTAFEIISSIADSKMTWFPFLPSQQKLVFSSESSF